MSKVSQESVDKLLSSLTDKELRAIIRNYALEHPTIVEALKSKTDKSSSKSAVFDYSSEVDRCYNHCMKTPIWEHDWRRHPDYLDWEEVGKALHKVIDRAEMSIDAGRPDIAIETAFLILKNDDRQYEEDFLFEREDWEADDLCLDDCFYLIEKALDSPVLTKEQKLNVCDRLEKFYQSELYDYAEYDIQELIDSVRGSLLTYDERLSIMMRNYRNETGWRKVSIACGIWDYLLDLGRTSDAEAFFSENCQIDELRVKYFDYLESMGCHEDAMKTIDEGIKIAGERHLNGLIHKWRERKLHLLENEGDVTAAASVCQDLFAEAHSSEVMKYYHTAKTLVDPEKWPSFRDRMLNKNKDIQYYAGSPLVDIYKEEGLMDRLYDHFLNARYNLMDGLSRYAKEFSADQQKNLIALLEKEFPISLGYNPTRRGYKELAGRLNALARICPAGKELATKVVEAFRSKYPNRPALIEELAKVKI